MRTTVGLILLFLLVVLSSEANAEFWVSAGLPSVYRFSETASTTLSNDGLRGAPSGFLFHAYIQGFPSLGYEAYQISLEDTVSDEPAGTVQVIFYDVGIYFSQRYLNGMVGLGYGSVEVSCDLTVCDTLEFKEGIARQAFLRLGVPIVAKLDFHLSVHRIIGKSEITSSVGKTDLVVDGFLYAYGFKVGW